MCGKIRYEREGEAERLRRPSVVAVTANPTRSPSVSQRARRGFFKPNYGVLSWL